MSESDYQSFLRGRPAPLPEQPQADYIRPVDRTTGEKIALMQKRGGTLAAAILDQLAAMGAEASAADRAAMIAEGYLTRDGSKITPRGMWAASDVLRDYARRFGVHQVEYRTNPFGRTTGHCSCGHIISNGNRLHSGCGLGEYERRHLEDVANGRWRPLSEIFDEVVAQTWGAR